MPNEITEEIRFRDVFWMGIKRDFRMLLRALPFATVFALLTVFVGEHWMYWLLLIPPFIWHYRAEKRLASQKAEEKEKS